MSNVSRPSTFVEDAAMVQSTRQRIVEQLRKLPKVDRNGKPLPPEPVVTPPTAPPGALAGIAASLGVNAVALLDSRSFLARVADIDSDDVTALTAAVTATLAESPHLAAFAPPAMQPNAAQGATSSPVATGGATPRERIRAQIEKSTPSTSKIPNQ